MSKSRRVAGKAVLVLCVVVLAIALSVAIPVSGKIRREPLSGFAQEEVPTFFLHGWSGSYKSETHMVNAVQDAGVTKTMVRVGVSPSGQATMTSNLPQSARNPLIEVSFVDNTNADYTLCGQWFKSVVTTVHAVYPFERYNVVAHSMGNMVLANYLRDTAGDASLPQLRKQVDLAGNFNGIIGVDDQPNQMTFDAAGLPSPQTPEFKALLSLRNTYPQSAEILNIYGDKGDGTHSDGQVSNASSRALRYLTGGRAKSYRELKITGPDAAHSNLHESSQVDRQLVDFIWRR
ncbi:putative cell surface hydrolase (putative) [Bifidobacterium actinocoloniiforme DSM 22766]|uniref:Putative cell surface hydrolase (Putative) n=1 Tax=Bifidobacterium actinocoloniiforme DSM 22766 TaxID=1437605 RepID=A0A086Z2N0_9BIFI|nr:alpha/beta hydrolase [Bifidobacterium actinocoloniiforme]AKV55752.1 hypothetical protein AB656_05735 [Bifidobacterium actinocoloniiforme DSM 22766]KFI40780.1 putative cell surface hydrolase (putative) [Bifidobacterium actinocoloniiforme DSM 22766]